MSNLIEHAKSELERVDAFGDGDFYGGMTGKAVMELIEVFSKQGHSGMSASVVRQLFNRLSDFKNISPITNNPDEWVNHGEYWQCKRDCSLFSDDNLKTCYSIDDRDRVHMGFDDKGNLVKTKED